MTKAFKMAMVKDLMRGHYNVIDTKFVYFTDIQSFNTITGIMTDNMMFNFIMNVKGTDKFL